MKRRTLRQWTAAVVLAAAAVLPVHAGGHHDQDRARRALEAGEILPLQDILARVGRDVPGQVIAVELERERDRWIYEIKLLGPDGSIVKLEVDARDGSVLKRRGGMR